MNDRLLVVKMIAYIEQNLVESINAEEMALQSGYSLNRFRQKFFDLLKEIGIEKKASYEFSSETPLEKRKEVEVELKRYLNDGSLCILDFMEHQLFSGYDEKGFIFLQPWNGKTSSETPALTYGTWNQCLEKEWWAHFSVISRTAVQRDIIETEGYLQRS